MRKLTLVAILILCLTYTVSAKGIEGEYIYKTYQQGTGKILEDIVLTIDNLKKGQKEYERTIKKSKYEKKEKFVLNKSYETIEWEMERKDNDTFYEGKRQGNDLILKGKLKGELFDKVISLDDRPFYYTPKFNLTGFVLSDQEKIQFWMLRKDKLSKYLMQAKKKGVKTIDVNGAPMEVVKIYYSATGPGEKYYKRTYYFRKSDGMFVRKKGKKNSLTELVSEG